MRVLCSRSGAAGVIFHGFPHKNARKILSTYFLKLSTKFSFIFFFLLFFSTPNKEKKLF